jgi:hypothetical protein
MGQWRARPVPAGDIALGREHCAHLLHLQPWSLSVAAELRLSPGAALDTRTFHRSPYCSSCITAPMGSRERAVPRIPAGGSANIRRSAESACDPKRRSQCAPHRWPLSTSSTRDACVIASVHSVGTGVPGSALILANALHQHRQCSKALFDVHVGGRRPTVVVCVLSPAMKRLRAARSSAIGCRQGCRQGCRHATQTNRHPSPLLQVRLEHPNTGLHPP